MLATWLEVDIATAAMDNIEAILSSHPLHEPYLCCYDDNLPAPPHPRLPLATTRWWRSIL